MGQIPRSTERISSFLTFSFCTLFFCHVTLENVAGIDALSSFPYQLAQLTNKEYLITIFKICQFFVLPVNL